MQQYYKTMLTFFVLVGLVASLYFFSNWFSRNTGYVLGEDQKIVLAQCLTNNNVVLYVSSGCFPCDNQLEVFGEEATQYLTIVQCNEIEDCPGVPGVPSWNVDGEFFIGKQGLNSLQEISGCIAE